MTILSSKTHWPQIQTWLTQSLLHIKPEQEKTIESVFEGMLQQRLRLKMNQQLAEWIGLG